MAVGPVHVLRVGYCLLGSLRRVTCVCILVAASSPLQMCAICLEPLPKGHLSDHH